MSSAWLRAALAATAAAAAAVSATPILPRATNSTTSTATSEPAYANGTLPIVIDEVVPGYGGLNVVWQETFGGSAGQMVNTANWEIITNSHVNNEWQQYTASNANIQISGGGTLQIVPVLNHATGQWTSGRVESWYVFTPADGRVTVAEAKIRFGTAPAANKQ
ncbi:hypothetical protein SLS62_010976, partial [Diatrype stigma]